MALQGTFGVLRRWPDSRVEVGRERCLSPSRYELLKSPMRAGGPKNGSCPPGGRSTTNLHHPPLVGSPIQSQFGNRPKVGVPGERRQQLVNTSPANKQQLSLFPTTGSLIKNAM
eukprot:gene14552-20593_t